MWLQDLLLLLLLASSIFLIGIPLFKLIKMVAPKKQRNPLAESKVRLEQAKLEIEAARLDRERDKLYNQMYNEALQELDEMEKQEKHK